MRVTGIVAPSLSVTAALGVYGCAAQECVSNRERPGVLLIDAESHQPICGAVVQLREGDYGETAVTGDTDAACSGIHRFSGRGGSYVATIIAPNYAETTATVTFREEECTYDVEEAGPRNGLPGYAYLVTVAMAWQAP